MEVKKQMLKLTLPFAGFIVLISAFFAPTVLAQPEVTIEGDDSTVTVSAERVEIDATGEEATDGEEAAEDADAADEDADEEGSLIEIHDVDADGQKGEEFNSVSDFLSGPAVTVYEETQDKTDFSVAGIRLTAGNAISAGDETGADVFAFGNSVSVDSMVAGDLFSAGNSVTVSAPVTGSARLAGNIMSVNNEVGGNLITLGNQVTIGSEAVVYGHYNSAAAAVVVDGTIMGKAAFAGETVIINGTIEGPVSIEANSVTFGNNAVLNGAVEVKGPNKPSINEGVSGQENVTYTYKDFNERTDKWERGANTYGTGFFNPGARIGRWLVSFLFFGVVGLICILVGPKYMEKVSTLMTREAGMSWMKGGLYFFVIPTAAFLLLFTIIGIPISLLGMFAYWILLLFGRLVAGLMLGKLIITEKQVKEEKNRTLLAFLVGYLLLSVLYYIPVVGGLIGLLASVWGVGAVIQSWCNCRTEKKNKGATTKRK